jgi:hypothetical protein
LSAFVASAQVEPIEPPPQKPTTSLRDEVNISSMYFHKALAMLHRESWLEKVPSFEFTLMRGTERSRFQIGGVSVELMESPVWVGYEYLAEGEVMVIVKLEQKW